MRRLLVWVVVATLLSSAASSWASADRPRVVVAKYVFEGTGRGVLSVHGAVRVTPGAMLVTAIVDESKARHPVVLDPQIVELEPPNGVRTHGAAGEHAICAAPLDCQLQRGTLEFNENFIFNGDRRHRSKLVFVIAARGASVRLHDDVMIRWHARPRTSSLVTRLDDDAAGTGVAVGGTEAGVETTVAAPGAAPGSLALAVPGCDISGVGTADLTGGRSAETVVCPAGPVGAVATGATRWALTGMVAGLTAYETRLIVIDGAT